MQKANQQPKPAQKKIKPPAPNSIRTQKRKFGKANSPPQPNPSMQKVNQQQKPAQKKTKPPAPNSIKTQNSPPQPIL
jgi:hypothetical protein